MKILVVGKGGREHTLVWKLAQSREIDKIFAAPGNDGMEDLAVCVNIDENDFEKLAELVVTEGISYAIVGPEVPLNNGIVDFFRFRGLKIFGPTAQAAKIESSKIFAKNLMKKYGIPTADFFVVESSGDAIRYLNDRPEGPVVVKADGLAAGKGVYLCRNRAEAVDAVKEMMENKIFGDAGVKIVLEEMMSGEEASLFVLTDGKNYVMLPPAQDHKRVYDNDEGKNTGGMGAYAPTPLMSENLMHEVESSIIKPMIDAMRNENTPFSGCLYAGLMITDDGPKVVEFNCRFGDPETQVVLPLLDDDLFKIVKEIADGELTTGSVNIKNQYAVCVVLASGGYPDKYEKNMEINGLQNDIFKENYIIFHAGTKKTEKGFITDGGRVLNIVSFGNTLQKAIDNTYEGVEKVNFPNMHYRKDIAVKGLKFN